MRNLRAVIRVLPSLCIAEWQMRFRQSKAFFESLWIKSGGVLPLVNLPAETFSFKNPLTWFPELATDVTSQIALPGVLLMVVTIVLALQIEVCNVRRQVSQRASAGVLPASRTQQRMQTFEHPLTALQQSIFAES